MSETVINSTLFITSIHQGKLGDEIEEQLWHLVVMWSTFDAIVSSDIVSSYLDIIKM